MYLFYVEEIEESGDVFIFVYKRRGEEIQAFTVWAKLRFFLLNLGGNMYSNVNNSLKN